MNDIIIQVIEKYDSIFNGEKLGEERRNILD